MRKSRLIAGGMIMMAVVIAGSTCNPIGQTPCADVNENATINVAGTYRYAGDQITYWLRGTISFTQDGNTVQVTGTTYDNAGDRDLVGTGTLLGNYLIIQLVPKNGDDDYIADIEFIFSDDGNTFCVEFSDTNGDAGDMGSYRGLREAE